MARSVPIPKRRVRYRLNDRILFEDCDGGLIHAELIAGVRNPDSHEDNRYYLVKEGDSKVGTGDSDGVLVTPVHMTGVHLKEWNEPDHTLTFIFKGEIVLGEDYLWVREDRITAHWKAEIDELEIIVEQIRKEVNEK